MSGSNLQRQRSFISAEQRACNNKHTGGVLWFTGLPGSGKSTLAYALERHLFEKDYQAFVLDGDNVRSGLNEDLGFSREGREENLRRVGEVANLFATAGFVVISALISPYKAVRARARAASTMPFHEVYISASLEVCEARDPKGHYARARAGDLPDFTGVSSPYEPPEAPNLSVPSGTESVDACVALLEDYVDRHFRGGPAGT